MYQLTFFKPDPSSITLHVITCPSLLPMHAARAALRASGFAVRMWGKDKRLVV